MSFSLLKTRTEYQTYIRVKMLKRYLVTLFTKV